MHTSRRTHGFINQNILCCTPFQSFVRTRTFCIDPTHCFIDETPGLVDFQMDTFVIILSHVSDSNQAFIVTAIKMIIEEISLIISYLVVFEHYCTCAIQNFFYLIPSECRKFPLLHLVLAVAPNIRQMVDSPPIIKLSYGVKPAHTHFISFF